LQLEDGWTISESRGSTCAASASRSRLSEKIKNDIDVGGCGNNAAQAGVNDTSACIDRGSIAKVVGGVENGPNHVKQMAM